MKKLLYAVLFAVTLSACANANKEEKDVQKEVYDLHEKTMMDMEKAMVNKMKLDTLITKADSLKLNKTEATGLKNKLNTADDKMSDWMSKFNPDNTGKNHDNMMKYWKDQKMQVQQIDSMMMSATAESAAYIKKVTGK